MIPVGILTVSQVFTRSTAIVLLRLSAETPPAAANAHSDSNSRRDYDTAANWRIVAVGIRMSIRAVVRGIVRGIAVIARITVAIAVIGLVSRGVGVFGEYG